MGPACWFQREGRCSTSGLGGLQPCSTRMVHTTAGFECRVPWVAFRWLEGAVRYSADTMTSKLSPNGCP